MKCQAWHVYTCVSAVEVFRTLKRGEQGEQVRVLSLVVLSIFQCGSEKSGAWTTSPNDRQSDRTKDFAAWCMGIYGRNAVSMSTWRVRSGSFHDTVSRFGQGKIDSYNNRQPNSMGSNHERLYRKEE